MGLGFRVWGLGFGFTGLLVYGFTGLRVYGRTGLRAYGFWV